VGEERTVPDVGADFVELALSRADDVTDTDTARGVRVAPPTAFPSEAVTEELLRGVAVNEPPSRVIVPCSEREIDALLE